MFHIIHYEHFPRTTKGWKLVASDVTATINEKHTLQSRKPFSTGEAWLFNGTLVDEKWSYSEHSQDGQQVREPVTN